MNKIGLYILSYVSALSVSVVGLLFGEKWSENAWLIGVLTAVSLLPILLYVLNVICTERFVNKIKSSKVADMNAFLVSHRDDAEKTAKQKLVELRRIRRLTTVYVIFVAVLAAVIAVLGGVLKNFEPALYTVCLIYSGLVFCSVYTRIRKKKQFVLGEDATSISKDDYPFIHSLAQKAADCIGIKDEIVILLSWDVSASIAKESKKVYLRLGVMLLHILTEEELYNILLHEFAHVSDHNSKSFREAQYNSWILEETGNKLPNIYLYFSAKYTYNYFIYEYASSVVNELYADKAMAKHGDPKVAVSALLKTYYDTLYAWEKRIADGGSIYEHAELKADYLSVQISSYKKAIAERGEFWNELIRKEIMPNSASHPTIKMRMEALGIQELKQAESKSSDEYLAEAQRILEFSEGIIYNERIKTYEKDRAEHYSEPLARIEEWHRSGSPISAETYADIISDLISLCRCKEAYELCDRVIEELPDLSAACAVYMKGTALLYRYDESGIDLIYRAIEQNGNFLEEGLDIVGKFCCLTGKEEALKEYRKKAAVLAQKHVDQNKQTYFLSKKDNLTKENLPDGMLEEILAYIRSVDQDIIQNIYLVRKTISEDFFTSVFIIHFYGGTDAQRNEIMHKIFRFLDSHPAEWQFSLFDYFEFPEVKVEKIEGSLVFAKDKK